MSAELDLDALLNQHIPLAQPAHPSLDDLVQAWVAERTAPELLPYEQRLVDRVADLLHKQIEHVEETSGMDARTGFALVIIQTEMERVKYIVRSYLRARIAKIDKYALYILRTPEQLARLSHLERQYLQKHQAVLERHFQSAFLRDLPDTSNLRRIDDTTAAGVSMVTAPDMKKAVFCRVLKEANEVRVANEKEELAKGSTVLLRYEAVKGLVADGSVVLI
jgi:GINS complex subunit 4